MHVLMLSWEYPPNMVGGLGKHVAEILPALARAGVQIDLVTPRRAGGETVERFDGWTVHRIATSLRPALDFGLQVDRTNVALERACREIIELGDPFDLIHNHDWLTSVAAASLKHRYRMPLVATIHATERGRGRGQLSSGASQRIDRAEWQLTYEAWRVICCTQYMSEQVHSFFEVPRDKIDVIPNGVDPSRFDALDGVDLTSFRSRYATPEERIVLYVGRIVREKGVEVLTRSVPPVLRKVPEARFVIAGKGPELEGTRELVSELDMEDKVLLPGFISDEDRDRLYKVADCAVFPSLYEPFGIVALEAMAARTPVVVSEVGGLPEVVRHGETGITVYPNNVGSCAWGIVHTLQNPAWARQRVENAYGEVLTVFNWDTIAQRTAEVYSRVAEERAQAVWL